MTKSIYKICILGDGGVGKSTLVNRYLTGLFDVKLKITIGVDFYVNKIQVNDRMVALQIWDFAGEDQFRFMLPHYLYGAAGAIFMYDITRFSSYRNFNAWMEVYEEGIKKNGVDIPLIMVGSKKDMDYKRAISYEDAQTTAEMHERVLGYLECSAKTGENIPLLFEMLTNLIISCQN